MCWRGLERVSCKADSGDQEGSDRELPMVVEAGVGNSKEGVSDGERSRARQSVFNWLCRLEGQRSRAQHVAVTLHYSHWPHNESLCNQLPTDQSLKPHTHCGLLCWKLSNTLPALPVFADASFNTHAAFFPSNFKFRFACMTNAFEAFCGSRAD